MKKTILKAFFKMISGVDFRVVFWDGEAVDYGTDKPVLVIIFNRELPISFNLADPALSFGEAYMEGIIDFEGNVDEILLLIKKNRDTLISGDLKKKLFSTFQNINNQSSSQRQRQNIQHHYDIGNDFFSLWLDETMSYSCAYFRDPDDSLTRAQIQKIDLILSKLQLKPGERLLDIGCGWGWLIIRAAQRFNVSALGITLSEEQYSAANRRINELGLSGQLEVRFQNYQELPDREQFDKVVSVGMFEHAGRDNMGKYMEKVHKILVPGGLSMLHTITGMDEQPVNSWVEKYIFPGGYIPSLRETIWLMPQYDFHLLHAESLRMHYAMTLDRWYENFTRNADIIKKKMGEKFLRMWGLYLRGCSANFRVTGLNVYQLLFSKGLNNSLPLTMEHVYRHS